MIRCIYSPFTDIYFHLAAEEYLLKQGNEDIFMLWQDTPSVVIGSISGYGRKSIRNGRNGSRYILPVVFPVGSSVP